MRDRSDPTEQGFECVDPKWGNQIWRRDLPDLDAATQKELADHLFICDACQLTVATEQAAASAMRSGRVMAVSRPRRVTNHLRILRWASTAALAASLALVFVLPPDGRTGGARRGDASLPHFVRPVEGEVLLSAAPVLKWSEIPDATSYRVQISEIGGDYLWSALVDEPEVRIPTGQPLPPDGIFRGLVQPVPGDLAGLADVSVAFSRSGWREFLTYRTAAAPLWLRVLGVVALLGLFGGIRWPRRPRALAG
jgi:hypothetical protein